MMHIHEWLSDLAITKDTVADFLKLQNYESLTINTIEYLGEGWDNKLFLINNELIFRFPHRKASIALMLTENKILQGLPSFSTIQTPKLKYLGQASAKYPYPCQGYALIPGISGYKAKLTEEERCENIAALAIFLKELHNIKPDVALSMGVIPQGFGGRSNIPETIKVLLERTNTLNSKSIIKINMPNLQKEIEIANKLLLPEERCLVHGDLDSRHLIFNNKKLSGIIDWGDTDLSNRAIDLDIIWTFFPQEAHNKFFEIYGDVEPNTWQYARFLGLYCSFSLMLYAHDLQDDLLFQESIAAIKRINTNLL